MKLLFEKSFLRDVKKLKDDRIKHLINDFIDKVKKANNSKELSGIKKISGHKLAYRKRIGDYRIGFFIENEHVIYSKCLHRKDIYRRFP